MPGWKAHAKYQRHQTALAHLPQPEKQLDCGKAISMAPRHDYISSLRNRKQACSLVCSVLPLIEFRILTLSRAQRGSLPPSSCSPQRIWSVHTRRKEGFTMVAFLPLLASDDVGPNRNLTYPPPAPPTFTVICAYSLSNVYGPGARFLYYGLVAVCIFAQRLVWMRELCFAAALLFSALASIHAIVITCYSDSGKYHAISLHSH